MILLDANVLVYAVNQAAPQHPTSLAVVQAAVDDRVPGVLVPQVLLEFWATVTNPRRIQKPLEPVRAWEAVDDFRAGIEVLEVLAEALALLGGLVRRYRPTGAQLFDLYLVAQMQSHGVPRICTYNVDDFDAIAGVEILTPEDVAARYEIA
jgi:uncharacterized protein